MSKDIKALLAQKLAENNQRHKQAKQTTELDFGSELKRLPISKIRINPYQPRTVFDDEQIDSLSKSIEEMGLLQPISVREITTPNSDVEYELIAGERRFRAVQRLHKSHIDAIILSMADADMAILALAENLQRQDLCDFEIGQALRQIENLFPNKTKLAEAIGINRQDMYRYFAYEALPNEFLDKLKTKPQLISRAAAEQLKKVLTKYELNETLANQVLNQAWEKLLTGELEQSKLADFVEKILQPKQVKIYDNKIQPLYIQGEKVGKIEHKAKKFVIELDLAYLNADDETVLQNLIHEWLTSKNNA